MLDMFAVAEEFREKHPEHFKTLNRLPATFHKVHYNRYIVSSEAFEYQIIQLYMCSGKSLQKLVIGIITLLLMTQER